MYERLKMNDKQEIETIGYEFEEGELKRLLLNWMQLREFIGKHIEIGIIYNNQEAEK